MKTITMTGGHEVQVDDADFELVVQFRWWLGKTRGCRYAVRQYTDPVTKKRTSIYMHRLITQAADGLQVDHRDGNGLNNTRANLRVCTGAENKRNMRQAKASHSSKFRGVYWNKSRSKWQVQIHFNDSNRYLGQYDNESDAAKAYNEAAVRLHGEFAQLNEVS